MAADIQQKYGTSNQSITITVASLGSASQRQSTAVDNTTNLFMDAKVFVKIKTNAAGTSASGVVNVFVAASADGGTSYSGGCTGSDAAYSGNLNQLIFLGSIPAVANATTYASIFNLSRAFGLGGIPANWVLVLDNQTGATLDSTSGNHSVLYQGILAQTV